MITRTKIRCTALNLGEDMEETLILWMYLTYCWYLSWMKIKEMLVQFIRSQHDLKK